MSPGKESKSNASRARTSARGRWALWFVAGSLVAVVSVPAYFDARANAVQERILVLEEAGARGAQLELLKEQQMARFEEYALTEDRAFWLEYEAALVRDDTIFDRLSVLSRNLDFVVQDRLSELQAQTVTWRYENLQAYRTDSAVDALAASRDAYADLRRGTRELNRAIQSEVAEGRRAVRSARVLQRRLTIALAILALGATLVVGRVGLRFRNLSEEAERRRRDAVQARREVDALVEATGDGVLGIDLGGKCTSLNRAGVQLLGFTEREIKGRDAHDTLMHTKPDGTPWSREESPILRALSRGEPVDSEDGAVLWRRKNREFPARWSLRPMIDGTELRGAVLTFTDMTEIHEKEEALRRAIQQREDVVSIVSHDLRNPLGVAMAAADLILDLPLDEAERQRQAHVIKRSGERMQSLIEDLLDVARIEEGAFVVHLSTERLLPILEEVHGMFEDQARRKGIRLRVVADSRAASARIDRDRIIQALANLTDNALRFTPEGGTISLGVAEQGGHVEVYVSDDGAGIEPELVDTLFDRFAQSSSSGGGAGLGLAIVKGVAEAHEGEVEVSSTPDRGATFTLRFARVDPVPADRVG
ncbi:MAG: PAS domain-containing sensor histidine kinase [Gemmatimonadota bacterium]|jgi:PAS domain S-box-containing protein